jgi:HK97 family phage portal protein
MSRQELFETIEQHLGLTGEGWPLLVRDERADWPIEWWPLYPHRMLPVPDPDKYLLGYLYQSPDGARIPIQFRDVPLMRQPHPTNFYGGLSAVRAVQTDLEATQAARMWNRTFFYNSAQPGGIIEVPRELTDDEFNNMRTHWQEQHQGVANAHRVAILEHGKWVNRHYSMRDMEFTHLLQMSAEEIRRAFRYPVAMLGDAGDVNRATALAHQAI